PLGERAAPTRQPRRLRCRALSVVVERIAPFSRQIITKVAADFATLQIVLISGQVAALRALPAWQVVRLLRPRALLTVLAGMPFAGMGRRRQQGDSRDRQND